MNRKPPSTSTVTIKPSDRPYRNERVRKQADRNDIKRGNAAPHTARPSMGRHSLGQHSTGLANRPWFKRGDWGTLLTGIWAIAAATATGLNPDFAQALERQTQTLFFELRQPVAPPQDVVILAIDDSSLAQGDIYGLEPQKYAQLEPIQSWPWRRAAYATAIDKLLAAGAKSVAVDVLLTGPSSYGDDDDQQLAQTLKRHPGKVVLAAQYAESETPQGPITQLKMPLPSFCDALACTGFINFLIEPDGRIHRFGEQFLTQLLQNSLPAEAAVMEKVPSFAQSTLRAAQIPSAPTDDSSIFFYGPAYTFEHIPFWYVLDSTTWKDNLQSGAYFKDKIVLIGSTAQIHQDFHPAPFSKSWLYREPMSGIEIHANAIASLLEGKTIQEAIPRPSMRSLLVLMGVVATGWGIYRIRHPLRRFAFAAGLATVWLSVSYGLMAQARLIVPTALPVGAIMLSGFSQLVSDSIKEQFRKKQLRDTLKQYVTLPVVQEIISQQEDFQDLLRERELEMAGTLLGGRYSITRVLGSGGFSETYIAEDLQRPDHPKCVVKRLRVMSEDPNTLRLARRLFATEAETLEELGKHPQIPQLLASFEENYEFYLVQELVQGHPLNRELLRQRSLPEAKVLKLIHDVLEILEFVHEKEVIHRDLKPSNIMRRQTDQKLVLIDFGVAKKITHQLAESGDVSRFTVAVGTPGYTPAEQSTGRPRFNSDIYALGMIGIEALTGVAPHTLNHNGTTGEVMWLNQAPNVDPDFAAVLNKMVCYDFKQRYQSVQEVQEALAPLMARVQDVANIFEVGDDPIDWAAATAALATGDFDSEEVGKDETVHLPEDWMNLGT